ncbi:hypothetical protein AMJ49_05545 [Parcubacteria bacterium DG_74_2]|nr:MAG: hypothetical protein AMJ49_05545 [Parcubacteria bacterium DG_74_2]
MATQGVGSFRTTEGITKVIVGCDGYEIPERTIAALEKNLLISESLSDFLVKAKFGCEDCLVIVEMSLDRSDLRFSCPRWKYTVAETITVDFISRSIEVSDAAKIAEKIWDKEERLSALGKELKSLGWDTFLVNIPETNEEAEIKASNIGALWR